MAEAYSFILIDRHRIHLHKIFITNPPKPFPKPLVVVGMGVRKPKYDKEQMIISIMQ
jgi:hypothetical protein